MSTVRKKILELFKEVFESQDESQDEPQVASFADDQPLLETGLDSLGLAIVVTRLDEELGIDPFSESEEVIYPETVAQFIEIYERALRA